jgi:hypothetical protein
MVNVAETLVVDIKLRRPRKTDCRLLQRMKPESA